MEVKDIAISIVVPLVAAVMSYFGSRRGAKVAKEDLENRKEATPPELLRLEKWSMILKDLEVNKLTEQRQGLGVELKLGPTQEVYITRNRHGIM